MFPTLGRTNFEKANEINIGDICRIVGMLDDPQFNGEIVEIIGVVSYVGYDKYYIQTDNKELTRSYDWVFLSRLEKIAQENNMPHDFRKHSDTVPPVPPPSRKIKESSVDNGRPFVQKMSKKEKYARDLINEFNELKEFKPKPKIYFDGKIRKARTIKKWMSDEAIDNGRYCAQTVEDMRDCIIQLFERIHDLENKEK